MNHTVIAKIEVENADALLVCDQIKEVLTNAAVENEIVYVETADGDTITSMEVVERSLSDGSIVHELVLHLG